MLVGIVPGNGTKEPKSLDPYLEIVVDELLALSDRVVYDAYLKAPFQLKVNILFYTLDYPGIGKVFGTMGSGSYQGCVGVSWKVRFLVIDHIQYFCNAVPLVWGSLRLAPISFKVHFAFYFIQARQP